MSVTGFAEAVNMITGILLRRKTAFRYVRAQRNIEVTAEGRQEQLV